MKFLTTGSIKSKQGPRQISTIALCFFLAYLIAQALLLFPGPVASESASLRQVLEQLHMDAFFLGVLLLFAGSLRLLLPGNQTVAILADAGAAFFILTARVAEVYGGRVSRLVAAGLFLFLTGSIIRLIYQLYSKD